MTGWALDLGTTKSAVARWGEPLESMNARATLQPQSPLKGAQSLWLLFEPASAGFSFPA
jgi:hypothetical protein